MKMEIWVAEKSAAQIFLSLIKPYCKKASTSACNP